MKTTHKKLAIGIFSLAALSCLDMTAAYAHPEGVNGYVTDTRGNIVKTAYNLCVRTGYWTPALAVAECDPDLVRKEEPKAAAPAPVPVAAPVVAPPPPPPPVVVAPPAKRKLTLSADSLFDFDKAVVKPEGKAHLDKFATDLKGLEYDVIKVTGHTDRVGSPSYNMKLSERRAEAVKTYLTSHVWISPNRVTAVGKGETEPETKPGQCKGEKVTPKLKECLSPDRRVEVEVSGMK